MKWMIVFIFAMVGLFADEFDKAIEDYNKGAYIKALNTFYALAKEGDAKAQYNVGLMYANGKGAAKDMAKAQQWYEKAASASGIMQAYNNLASFYLEGKGVKQDQAKAFELFQKAASMGDSAAQVNVAVLYAWGGEGITQDKMKAYENLKKALSAGQSEASGYLDTLCKESSWVCQD
ncbi:MAG: hypothetical protein B7Y23_09880 [Sulfurovum sp. 16-42-52]|nr:MAG: hypothetical protein B7Y23_09880 [Sulfurovum sp. 16-42-52]